MDWFSEYVIDWQAWATFATGLAAVGGAIYVGRRQTEISHRQNQILERQTELEELKLKSELYERRLEVFNAVKAYMMDVMYGGEMVNDWKIEEQFRASLVRSKFLFGSVTLITINNIASDCDYYKLMRSNAVGMSRLKDSTDERELQSLKQFEEKTKELASSLSSYLENLPQLFGHELQLGARTDPEAPE